MQVIRATIIPCHCYGSTSGILMISQMQQPIRNCMCCLQHEGNLPKLLLHPIAATAPLDLLHIDFTSIEMTMELNLPPCVISILVFQGHFMGHIVAYVTHGQMTRAVTGFLYWGCILVFRALARLLSDWGAGFVGSIIEGVYMLLGMRGLWTALCHPQANGLVKRSHQAIM